MKKVNCLNLKSVFGDRYKVTYEESYYGQYGKNARVDDPELQIILCRHGEIYPQGGDLLAASTNKRGRVAIRLAALDCTTILQDGGDGITVEFHIDHFDAVAALMKPRRRRRLSEEERTRLAEMGRANLNRYREVNVGSPEIEPESRVRTASESEAVWPCPRGKQDR